MPYETQAQADGTTTLRFVALPGGTGRYLVVPAGQENLPISVSKCTVRPMKAAAYLAVGPGQFSVGVQPLLMLRSKEGIRASFVDQEDVFNYYGFGRYGPAGIQKMVRAIVPQYLLLLGRTTYDYRNYSGANVDPMCPTFLISTTFWSQATSDSMFGDLGRGYPEVAVGRLPVNNTSELNGAVRHILNYKGAPESGVRIHAVADRTDPAVGDFGAQGGWYRTGQPGAGVAEELFRHNARDGAGSYTGDESGGQRRGGLVALCRARQFTAAWQGRSEDFPDWRCWA